MDDLISRQAAIENSFEVYTKEYGWCEVVGVDAINELPSAQPEQKKGHWIDGGGNYVKTENGIPVISCWCSECGDWLTASDEYSTKGIFCPNCGAKMEE